MKPDDVALKYIDKNGLITVDFLRSEDEVGGNMIIQGDKNGLHMLSELILAIADSADSESFQISPRGAGRKYFVKNSLIGIYIKKSKYK